LAGPARLPVPQRLGEALVLVTALAMAMVLAAAVTVLALVLVAVPVMVLAVVPAAVLMIRRHPHLSKARFHRRSRRYPRLAAPCLRGLHRERLERPPDT
jgi:4-hydroxybenzoate polyprenyltransferase